MQYKEWSVSLFFITHYIDNEPNIAADIYYNLAKTYHMLLDFNKALTAIEKAIELQATTENYILLATIAEDDENFEKALEAYKHIDFSKSKLRKNYLYRLGYTYYQLANYQAACDNWMEYAKYTYTENNGLRKNPYYCQAISIIDNEPNNAIELLKQAIYSEDGLVPRIYTDLGNIYYKQRNYEQAAIYFKQAIVYPKKIGVFGSALTTPFQKRIARYTTMYDTLPLDDSAILYISSEGNKFLGNPLAIFNQLKLDPNYHHYIVLKDDAFDQNNLMKHNNVSIVTYNSELHLKLLASAKFIITDSVLLPYFTPKPNQKILNTCNGTTIKKIGFDIPQNYYNAKNISKSFRIATHVIAPNDFMLDKIITANTLDKYNATKYKTIGSPYQDIMLNINEERKIEIKAYLGIPLDRKVILYAPAFREIDGKLDTSIDNIMWKVRQKLSNIKDAHTLYLAPHDSPLKDTRLNQFDPRELLAISDILVSDYSSLSIDFLPLNRPIVRYLFNTEKCDYDNDLYFDTSTVSDYCTKSIKELVSIISKLVDNPTIGPKQANAKTKFCSFDEGNSTSEVIKFFLEDNEPHNADDRNNILFFTGDISKTNGVTRAFENLVSKMTTPQNKITILVLESTVKSAKSVPILERLHALGHNIIINFGRNLTTAREAYALAYVNENLRFGSDNMKLVLDQYYERNVRKLLGNHTFDTIINFGSGYTTGIHALLTMVPANNRILVLHNDMLG
ncbi:MAG: CDP-glycerol glycerophosphotransferase family protein, partial [Erysipelotrichaceae bacterium]